MIGALAVAAQVVIERLRPALRKSSLVKLPTASGWITVRLEAGSDIDLLATLVSAAGNCSEPQ
ncbi:hypothetical protein T261_8430 [Streptomyces lydicus]|nr:hypothetical protein T261_8430 [Streptomyces lydicus]